jgi:undecaprenyl-diphosphatase
LSGNIFNNEVNFWILLIGFLSSFITGVLACKLMLKIVKNNNLIYFSFYCFVLGLISIFII